MSHTHWQVKNLQQLLVCIRGLPVMVNNLTLDQESSKITVPMTDTS